MVCLCACARLEWRSFASPVSLYGSVTHIQPCPTNADFHSWCPVLQHTLLSAIIMSIHAFCPVGALFPLHIQYVHMVMPHAHTCLFVTWPKLYTLRLCAVIILDFHYFLLFIHTLVALRFQCVFHQLRGLVTLRAELLNSGLNAVKPHGWCTTTEIQFITPCSVLFSTPLL